MANFVTQIGEAFVGCGAEAAHLNTVLGLKGTPVEAAWVTALASPSQGHVPFVAVLQPGLPVKPFTLFINKASIAGNRHAELTWGAGQAGVAQGVAEAVSQNLIPRELVNDLLVIAAVWVDPSAQDPELVFANNSKATLDAIGAGATGSPKIGAVVEARSNPFNPYFRFRG